MRIDIVVNAQSAPEEIARLAMRAENYGLGTVWTASYLASRDPWSNLVAAAQATRAIGIGVIAVNPYDTHPVRIATSLLTFNEQAAGRARIVVGGGGEALQALGIRPQRRVRAVAECMQILKGAASGQPLTFHGKIFQVENYWPAWARVPGPPVYVAANKPQMLRMAARLSDGVMFSDLPPSLCAERIGWVRQHLREFGRDTAAFRYNNFLAWHVYEDADRARQEARRWLGYRGLFRRWVLTTFMSDADYDVIEAHKAEIYGMVPAGTSTVPGVPDRLLDACVDNLTLTGTPAQLARYVGHLKKLSDAGLTEVTLELHEEAEAAIRLIGEQIAPALRQCG